MNKSKHRIEWIEYAKAITMLLVIFNHLGLRDSNVAMWVWTIHVPTFFFLSGLFANGQQSWSLLLRKNVSRLLIPALLWWLIGSFIWHPIQIYYLHSDSFWQSYWQSQLDFLCGTECGFAWFLVALFLLRVEYKLLFYISNQWIRMIIGLIVLPSIAYSVREMPHAPYYFYQSLMAFPLYYGASLLKNRILNWNSSVCHSAAWFILFFSFSLLLLGYNTHQSMNALLFSSKPILGYIQNFVGAFSVLTLSYFTGKLVISNKLINVIGEDTVVILLFQVPFLLLFKVLYRQFFHVTMPSPYYDTVSAAIASIMIEL